MKRSGFIYVKDEALIFNPVFDQIQDFRSDHAALRLEEARPFHRRSRVDIAPEKFQRDS